MKNEILKFCTKLILFIVLFVVLTFIWVSVPQWRFQFTNKDTESNLLIMPSNENLDIVMLGTSHGRTFSRYGNHQRVENILQSRILNLSKGNGGGPFVESLFLSYFYEQKNKADVVLYFIDPWVFYSAKWNEENFFLSEEPLNLNFLTLALKYGTDKQVIFNYLKTKLGVGWLLTKPTISLLSDEKSLAMVDKEAVEKRIENLYPDGTNEDYARLQMRYMENMLDLASQNKTKTIFIIPPTLLGNLPGHAQLIKRLEEWKKTYSIEFFDFSDSMSNPSLYADHDHLNSKGIDVFTQKFIKPILR